MCKQARQLIIDSKDRISSSNSTCDFVVQFKEVIRANGIRLDTIIFPNSMYNVNQNNNKIYFNDGDNRMAILVNGNYDILTLRQAIKEAMELVSNHIFDVIYDEKTLKYQIDDSTGNFNFTFDENSFNSARYLLGFLDATQSAASSQTSDFPPVLSRPHIIYVNIEQFSHENLDSSSHCNYHTFHFQNDVNAGDIVYFNRNQYYEQNYLNKIDFRHLSIKLTDQDGRQIDNNGSDWQMILSLM